MAGSLAPLNADTPITQDTKGRPVGFATTYLRQWLLSITAPIQAAVGLATKAFSLANQAASVATVALLTTSSAGLYRIQIYSRIAQAATVSSSLTVTLSWLDRGVAVTHTFDAIVGNTIVTVQASTWFLRADAVSDIAMQVTYASAGATPMQFNVDATVEQVA